MKNLSIFSQQLSTLHLLLPAAVDLLWDKLPGMIWAPPYLRELQVHATGRLWIKASVPDVLTDTALNSFVTVRTLDWLRRPLGPAMNRRLMLSNLDLRNICICRSDDIPR